MEQTSTEVTWKNILRDDQCVFIDELPKELKSSTFSQTKLLVKGWLYPDNVDDVQKIVSHANINSICLYPISKGKNWGLGSAQPVQNSWGVNLERMNKILHFDPEFATITVEPGVTFLQVDQFLEKNAQHLLFPMIGGSSEGSLIGNALDRGIGSGPNGERLPTVSNLEIILGSGELIRTGFDKFSSENQHPDKYGVGPFVDGIFTQSNFGIVTKMTFQLQPKPVSFHVFYCSVPSEHLNDFTNTIQDLIFRGVLQANCFTMWNKVKAEAVIGKHNWLTVGANDTMIANGTMYCFHKEEGELRRKIIQQSIEPYTAFFQFTDADETPDLWNSISLGKASDRNIKSIYRFVDWPTDGKPVPERDNCGLIWLCPSIPFRGKDVLASIAIAEQYQQDNLEIQIGFSGISSRVLHLFVSLVYSREVQGADQKVMELHKELFQQFIQNNYFPYRLSTCSMHLLPSTHTGLDQLFQQLKKTMDPNGIIAPGRYVLN